MPDKKMVKGAVMNGYLRFVKRKWGIEGVKEALKYVGMDVNPKDGEWIPAEATTGVLEWIKENKGEEYVEYAGRYASTDLGVFTQMIAAFINIEKFMKRASATYKTLFNYGEFLIDSNEHGAVVTIKDAKEPEPSCLAWKGALEGILIITHTKGTIEPLEPEDPKDCRFLMTWK